MGVSAGSTDYGWLGCGCGDDAAGDAIAGVAGGVGLKVVGLLVDDDGGSAVGEDGVRGGGIEREEVESVGGRAGAVGADNDVLRQVAVVVALGVELAVVLAGGIEVAT